MDELEPLEDFCEEHGLPWSDAIADKFGSYLDLLEQWNQRTNLIGPLDREQIVNELFVDSLTPAVIAPPTGRVLDAGTGAGLPGIPLAIVFDDAHFTLVEPRRKRVQFLRIACHRLGLEHVELFEGRIEDLEAAPFDWAISKAFRPPAQWLETASEWMAPGGMIVCLQSADALEDARRAAEELGLEPVGEVGEVADELGASVPAGRAITVWADGASPAACGGTPSAKRKGNATGGTHPQSPVGQRKGNATSGIHPWETLGTEEMVKTPVFGVKRVHRRSPGGTEAKFFVADMPDWVNVIAMTPDEKIVLIRQYRQGTDSITLEIPGGVVDPGESYLETGIRELREETGYEAEEYHQIGLVEPNPALQNNRCATVVAIGARPTAETNFDEHEEIEVVLASLDEAYQLVMRGEITHALVVAAFFHYREWRRTT
jgi:16S rRNA (guanine(527)-N(7))-methyltransferase RsmG